MHDLFRHHVCTLDSFEQIDPYDVYLFLSSSTTNLINRKIKYNHACITTSNMSVTFVAIQIRVQSCLLRYRNANRGSIE